MYVLVLKFAISCVASLHLPSTAGTATAHDGTIGRGLPQKPVQADRLPPQHGEERIAPRYHDEVGPVHDDPSHLLRRRRRAFLGHHEALDLAPDRAEAFGPAVVLVVPIEEGGAYVHDVGLVLGGHGDELPEDDKLVDRIAAAGGEDLGIDDGTRSRRERLAGRHSVDSKVGMDVRLEGVVDDKVGGELESSHGWCGWILLGVYFLLVWNGCARILKEGLQPTHVLILEKKQKLK